MADKEDESSDSTKSSKSKESSDLRGSQKAVLLNLSPKKPKERAGRYSYDSKNPGSHSQDEDSSESAGAASPQMSDRRSKHEKEKEKEKEDPSSPTLKSSLLKKTVGMGDLKQARTRSSSLSAADASKVQVGISALPSPSRSGKNDFHKFQPKTKSKPVTCKICNKFIWGSGGYTCIGCNCAVHTKGCAPKAREEGCCPKPLSSPFIADNDLNRISSFSEGEIFKLNMPNGKQKLVVFTPGIILADLLHQIDVENQLKNFVCFDGEGKPLHDIEIPLSKMKASHVYYVPKGMPLAMVPGLLGFGQTIQLLAVKSEEQKSRRNSSAGNRRQIQKKSNVKGESNRGDSGRKGILNISLKSARQLVSSDDFEFIYVVISNPLTEQHFRSKPLPFSTNPEWNQQFKAAFNGIEEAELHFKIWTTSKNGTSADTVIGQLTLEVKDFSDGDSINKIYTIKKEPKKLKLDKSKPGQIRVKWKFLERHFKAVKTDTQTGEESDESEEITELTDTNVEKSITESGEIQLESKNIVVASENVGELNAPLTARARKKITDVYEFGQELGRGAYSVVKVVFRKDNRQTFACKILDNYSNIEDAEEEEQNFQRETSILRKLNHANVCRIYDVFKDRKHYYVVLENVAGGELFDQLMERGFYSEADAAPLVRQIFSALSHVHGHGFAHRDIKPENLLFSDSTYTQLKIVDFGEAKSTRKGPLSDYVGTPDYMSPEVVKGMPYTNKVDCWAAGVVVYILLCGFPPFQGDSEAEVFINIMNIRYEFPAPEWDEVSPEGKDFIKRLLTDNDNRMSSDEALEHPWIKKFAPQ